MARRSQSYGLQNPLQDVFPAPVVATRAPVTADASRYEIGQMWVDKSANQVYVLSDPTTWSVASPGASDVDTLTGDSGGALSPSGGNINILGGDGLTVAGSGSTLTINRDAAGGYPITPYVVGASGEAGYTTVQAGINAANAAGGGLVFIQQGTYTEDLTLYDSVFLMGDSESGTIIAGTHTPPSAGTLNFWRLAFTDASAIFSSAAAGSTSITVEDCSFTVTNGYTFDLANWTGTIAMNDVSALGTHDGFSNNTGGSAIFLFNASVGVGTSNAASISGTAVIKSTSVGAPLSFVTGSTGNNIDASDFNDPVTFANNCSGSATATQFDGGASAAITMSSSGDWVLSQCSLTSSNSPALDGAGAGTLTLEDLSMLGSDDSIAATLTLANGSTYNGTQYATTFDTNVATAACTLSGTTLAVDGTDSNIGFTLSQKGTGAVSLADGTAGVAVTMANGVNTVAQTVNIASGDSAGDNTVSILGGDAASGTQTLNLATGTGGKTVHIADAAAVNTLTIGSSNSTSTTTIQAGSGGVQVVGDVDLTTGTLAIEGAAQGINIEGGAVTDRIGTCTLAAGTVTVANTNVTTNSRILLTRVGVNASTALGSPNVVITASTNFVVTALDPSDASTTETGDVSTFHYMIMEQL